MTDLRPVHFWGVAPYGQQSIATRAHQSFYQQFLRMMNLTRSYPQPLSEGELENLDLLRRAAALPLHIVETEHHYHQYWIYCLESK